MSARGTKYTYGQFASVRGKRYRVRKNKSDYTCHVKCALYKNGRCKLMTSALINHCLLLIPINAYFEKV